MTDLPARLRKLLEFDERYVHNEAMALGFDSNLPGHHKAYECGARVAHGRLRPLLEAMMEVCSAISRERQSTKDWNAIHDEDIVDLDWKLRLVRAQDAGQKANEDVDTALTALETALEAAENHD